ncbi:hypothetical protein L1887_55730 [Cichorium endivia]|nr:hypothetical protein L1887_55730 [Cichorium endivia]
MVDAGWFGKKSERYVCSLPQSRGAKHIADLCFAMPGLLRLSRQVNTHSCNAKLLCIKRANCQNVFATACRAAVKLPDQRMTEFIEPEHLAGRPVYPCEKELHHIAPTSRPHRFYGTNLPLRSGGGEEDKKDVGVEFLQFHALQGWQKLAPPKNRPRDCVQPIAIRSCCGHQQHGGRMGWCYCERGAERCTRPASQSTTSCTPMLHRKERKSVLRCKRYEHRGEGGLPVKGAGQHTSHSYSLSPSADVEGALYASSSANTLSPAAAATSVSSDASLSLNHCLIVRARPSDDSHSSTQLATIRTGHASRLGCMSSSARAHTAKHHER